MEPMESEEIDRGQQHVDPRFLLANERTFLAWNRTALAIIAAGVAVTQLLDASDHPTAAPALGLPLVILGAVVAQLGYRRWRRVEQALLQGRRLPTTRLPAVLTAAIVMSAAVGAIVATAGPFEP